VLAEGGELIIDAPDLSEISFTHGPLIEEVGYHCRDFFLKQWDKYRHYPWGILAHSTHVHGLGTYENGVEKARARVVLATIVLGAGMWWANQHFDWLGLRAQPWLRVGLLTACLGAAGLIYFGVLMGTGLKLRKMLRR